MTHFWCDTVDSVTILDVVQNTRESGVFSIMHVVIDNNVERKADGQRSEDDCETQDGFANFVLHDFSDRGVDWC